MDNDRPIDEVRSSEGNAALRLATTRTVLDEELLLDLKNRLARTRLPPDLGHGWDHGVPADWLRDLVEDWAGFDTVALQDRLDGLTHLRAEIDG